MRQRIPHNVDETTTADVGFGDLLGTGESLQTVGVSCDHEYGGFSASARVKSPKVAELTFSGGIPSCEHVITLTYVDSEQRSGDVKYNAWTYRPNDPSAERIEVPTLKVS